MAPIKKRTVYSGGGVKMAKLQIHTYEPDVTMDVEVPEYLCSPLKDRMTSEKYYEENKKDLSVLWLLHGAEGNSSDWFRYSQAELFAQENNIIITCPNGENGFWTNMARGVGWSDMFAIKIWSMVHKILPTSDAREKNYIAGTGMGGYGAIKLALENPELFTGVAVFDGWVDAPTRFYEKTGDYPDRWALEEVFGDEGSKPKTDLQWLLSETVKSGGPLPELYFDCSVSSLYCEANMRLADAAEQLGYIVKRKFDRTNEGWRLANCQLEDFIKSIKWA